MPTHTLRTVAAPLVFALLACSEAPAGPGLSEPGFRLTLIDSTGTSRTRASSFARWSYGGQTIHTDLLFPPSDQEAGFPASLKVAVGVPPQVYQLPPGTYPIASTTSQGAVISFWLTDGSLAYAGSGTVEVTHSDSTTLKAHFRAQVAVVVPTQGAVMQLRGSFVATPDTP